MMLSEHTLTVSCAGSTCLFGKGKRSILNPLALSDHSSKMARHGKNSAGRRENFTFSWNTQDRLCTLADSGWVWAQGLQGSSFWRVGGELINSFLWVDRFAPKLRKRASCVSHNRFWLYHLWNRKLWWVIAPRIKALPKSTYLRHFPLRMAVKLQMGHLVTVSCLLV